MRTPFALLLALSACKDSPTDTAAAGFAPDLFCPGDPSGACADNDGALRAGVGVTEITPTCYETWVDADGDNEWGRTSDGWLDCGCDQLCPEDAGYPGADAGEADGEFQAVWMGGFSNGHPAQGVHDPLWARAVVLDQGSTRLAIVSLDLVGFFHDDVLGIREEAAAAGLEVDHVLVSSTHQHEGPDTMGLWGERIGRSGYDPEYVASVRAQAVLAIAAAVEGLQEVGEVRVAQADPAQAHERGQANLVRDSRDPVIVPDTVDVATFAGVDGALLFSVVSWGNHPEVLASGNYQMTSDFAHYLRLTLESGSTWTGEVAGREGLGVPCVYLQGMVGGLMTPLGVTVHTPDGRTLSEASFEKAEALGQLIGEMALDALGQGEALSSPALSFTQSLFKVPVENWGFQGMFKMGVFQRTLYDFDPDEDIDDVNYPWLMTEVNHIRLGELELLTVPGELLPEIAIGGYDGSKVGTDLYPLLDPSNPNPPDLASAPPPPYLRDLMGGRFRWVVGLANDELGYIIPEYDYILHPESPYLSEADGDHYEETNSIGPRVAPLLIEQAERLLAWSP